MSAETISRHLVVPSEWATHRVDQALASLLPEFSRAQIQAWLQTGNILVDGQTRRPKDKLRGGEIVELHAILTPFADHLAQDIPLIIIYEDDDLLVVNKPPGLVCHPAPGHRDSTLVNALLHHAPQLESLPRAGLIHRLDKDTSGLLLIGKHLASYTELVRMLQIRAIKRRYLALVYGDVISGGTIDAPIGRHKVQRTLMAVVSGGKPARTHYRVQQTWPGFSLLQVELDTGRTHQIRVHMAHIRHPIVGDPLYARLNWPKDTAPEIQTALRNFQRQALHAWQLSFQHPVRLQAMQFEEEIPDDFKQLIAVLMQ